MHTWLHSSWTCPGSLIIVTVCWNEANPRCCPSQLTLRFIKWTSALFIWLYEMIVMNNSKRSRPQRLFLWNWSKPKYKLCSAFCLEMLCHRIRDGNRISFKTGLKLNENLCLSERHSFQMAREVSDLIELLWSRSVEVCAVVCRYKNTEAPSETWWLVDSLSAIPRLLDWHGSWFSCGWGGGGG